MKLSIFGSTGFVGGNFCNRFPNHLRIKRDCIFPDTQDILYFISTAHNHYIFEDLTLDVKTNLFFLCKVLENCKNKELTFNYISTMNVYGFQDKLPIKENSQCYPEGLYPITKKCAEDIVITFCKTFDVNYRILRLCNVIGIDKSISRKKNAITWMINQLITGKDIDLFEGGNYFREVMHINDVCDAIKLVCEKGNKNEIYNIGSGEAITLRDLMEKAKRIKKSQSKINTIRNSEENTNANSKSFWLDTSKLNDLGFKKNYSIDDIVNSLHK